VTKKLKPAPANGEAAAANGEGGSAQPSPGRVRRRDKLLQSLTALVGAKGDDARTRADSRSAGNPGANSAISTIEEEEEEEDEDVVEERRLAAKRSEAAERIFARLNAGPPPPPGTSTLCRSLPSSRSHRPLTSPGLASQARQREDQGLQQREGQDLRQWEGGAWASGRLGPSTEGSPQCQPQPGRPSPAASARFAAMSAAASGHPQYGVARPYWGCFWPSARAGKRRFKRSTEPLGGTQGLMSRGARPSARVRRPRLVAGPPAAARAVRQPGRGGSRRPAESRLLLPARLRSRCSREPRFPRPSGFSLQFEGPPAQAAASSQTSSHAWGLRRAAAS